MKKQYIKPTIQVCALTYSRNLLHVVSDYETSNRTIGDVED